MSAILHISSFGEFRECLQSSIIVVTDFYADWCGPCKAVAPVYEQLSSQLSRPQKITFTKVNTDHQEQIAQSYNITAMPTFLVFKHGKEVSRVKGADSSRLLETVKRLAAEVDSNTEDLNGFEESSASRSGVSIWRGAEISGGFTDITEQVDTKDLDLLNNDSDLGTARTLFDLSQPSSLQYESEGKKVSKPDWVESDTDEQLLLYIPFQATLKIHTIQITSLTPVEAEGGAGGASMRPKTIKLYTNQAHNLGFEEAEDLDAVQEFVLTKADWNDKTGTAKMELRFVKFQKVTSLVLFVVNGDGTGERVRIDRLRIIGDTGVRRAMGKLEKVGDDIGGE